MYNLYFRTKVKKNVKKSMNQFRMFQENKWKNRQNRKKLINRL